MNCIFDIGNVLVDFKPEIFVNRLYSDKTMANKVLEVIFYSREWLMLDKGVITPNEACANFIAVHPHFKTYIIQTMERLHEMLTPMTETIELLPKLKEQGHKLYYLSNYHKELSDFIKAKYSFFDYFDGGVFSCDVKMLKPSPEIYQYILDSYRLVPQECVFFDDTLENVKAANAMGMNGVLFTNADDVKNFFRNI